VIKKRERQDKEMVVIGIDLGTTMSVCAYYNLRTKAVEIIPDTTGKRLIPSYVAFTESERFIGHAAKNQATRNPENTLFDAKRFIGYSALPQDLSHISYPFSLSVDTESLKMYVPVQDKWFLPEEISAMVLTSLKDNAEAFLAQEVTGAVITVPAYFNNSQKKCTKNAAAIAGLEVIRLINEPTSAALAYGYGYEGSGASNSMMEQSVLIVDIGGGTTDLTVLDIESDVIEVKATRGDMYFGGEDFDNQTVRFCIKEFNKVLQKKQRQKKSTPALINLSSKDETISAKNNKVLRKLHTACEKAKIALSSTTSTSIEIDSLWEGEDCCITLSRAKFESLNAQYFNKIRALLDNVLNDAQRSKKQIDDIILIGGSTRIPKIRKLISDYFGGKKLNYTLHPDEAVAYGAALQAHYLTDECDDEEKTLLIDVIPLTLGIETKGGIMDPVLEKNTTIPTRNSNVYSTAKDSQSSVTVKVYEGERAMCEDNKLIGKFNLRGIAPASRGIAQIEVVFEVDADGILQVSAFDQANPGSIKKVTVESSTDLSTEEINRLIAKAVELNDRDTNIKNKVNLWNQIETVIYFIEEFVENCENSDSTTMTKDDKFDLEQITKEAREWMGENEGYKTNEELTADDLATKHFELQGMANPIMSRLYDKPEGNISDDSCDDEAEEVEEVDECD